MSITDQTSGTRVDEIAAGVYRISTPVPPSLMPGGFTFNQFLIDDEAPLLFHTGPRRLFALTLGAVAHVLGDVARLRYVSFSHVEADECGAMNDWLAASPRAEPLCSTTAAMVSMNDLADRPPRALADGEELSLGRRTIRWLDTPHLPHGWESGLVFETASRTLLCGDLLTRFGAGELPPLTTADVLEPALAMHAAMPYLVHGPHVRPLLEKLAHTEPRVLGLMHGSSFEGDGGRTLLALADALGA
ncbi:MAG: oxygen-binding di-iron domain-containing protein [Myxococcaceae bacterium]